LIVSATSQRNAPSDPSPIFPSPNETAGEDFTGTTHTPDPHGLPLSLPGETASAAIANRVGELLSG